jgi:Protein of unknown function (DUF3500)
MTTSIPARATVVRRCSRLACAIAAVAVVASCSSGTSGSAPAAPTSTGPTSTGPTSTGAATASTGTAVPAVTSAATAFLAALDDSQRDAVLFEWTDTAQKQRWSNFPPVAFQRAGLQWGDLSQPQQDAWLAIMRAALSTEGYDRVLAEWAADDANAELTGQPDLFGRQYYYVALIGNPSETDPWMWQFGGHHLAVNAAVAGGRVSVTPSFLGSQPGSYTDADGTTVRPLGDIVDDAFALLDSLDDAQKQAAVLGDAPINLVLGPGEDGQTVAPEGVPLSGLTDAQRAAALTLIRHYTGLVNDADAAARTAEVESGLDQTSFAWFGPTTPGSVAYFRVTGPTILIEYAPQAAGGGPGGGGAGGGPPGGGPPSGAPQGGGAGGEGQAGAAIAGATEDHIHGIYRDPTNEYGSKYAS